MQSFRLLSASEQVADHLRDNVERGILSGTAPGVHRLAADFGVHRTTVEEALRQLEREGVLIPQGVGRRRLIAMAAKPARAALKVRMLLYERIDKGLHYRVDLLHRLAEQGHSAAFAEKSLHDLGMDVNRVAAYVKSEVADAWIVGAGSREILEWFAAQPIPAFAIFGGSQGLPLAGIRIDKLTAMKAAVRKLHALGHRRIVLMVQQEGIKPRFGLFEQTFMDELHALGIVTGPYNLPDWGNETKGFHRCLDTLFQHTPPTALILSEARLFIAAYLHLARRGIAAPRDVSLVCDDPDIAFCWCEPPVSHIRWDSRPVVNRIVQWADNVARGKEDRRQRATLAEFVEGGTIGPAREK